MEARTLSRRARLTRAANFREAFDQGRSAAGRFLVMWLRTKPDADRRLGVVASKRTLRRAVDRCRAKRLLREAYRLNRARFRRDVDVVLVARRGIIEVKRQAVERDLLQLGRRLGALPA